ncbi:MAG: B12-binding domain-containing protein [Candidatus Odinarchaeota archaeon]
MSEEIYRQMADSVINLDLDAAKKLAKQAVDEDLNLLEVIEKGFGEGIKKVGDLWDEGEYFLPELMRGAQVMQEAVDIITPKLQSSGSERQSLGKVVIATIEGDIHSIGKTIVGTMLRANGFEVIDMGADIPAEKIVDEALTSNANIIGVSALLTTTMINQKKVVELLKEKNVRDKVKVMLGGAPVTEEWVKECEADAYAENAVEAVSVAKLLLKK